MPSDINKFTVSPDAGEPSILNVISIRTESPLPAAGRDEPDTSRLEGVTTEIDREVPMDVSLNVRTGPTVTTVDSKFPTKSTATTATYRSVLSIIGEPTSATDPVLSKRSEVFVTTIEELPSERFATALRVDTLEKGRVSTNTRWWCVSIEMLSVQLTNKCPP